MKKGLMLLIFCAGLLSAPVVFAQVKGGPFVGYGSDVDQMGLGGIAEFTINDHWGISPSLLFYFPETNSNYRFSWYEFNLNVNYYFFHEGPVHLYGIGGMNYLRSRRKEQFGNERTFASGEVGMNVGIGSNFDIGKKFMPFAELKFVLGEPDQIALFFGLKF
jgi:outer membrane immunogenic protein